jgi:hypothetical protein
MNAFAKTSRRLRLSFPGGVLLLPIVVLGEDESGGVVLALLAAPSVTLSG